MTDQTHGGKPELDGAFLAHPPRFLSLEFHLNFLPRVIAFRFAQYRRRDRNAREHVYVELPLVIAGCILLIVFGLPGAVDHGSVPGLVSTAIGAGGLLALVTWSVIVERRARRQEGYRYDYAVFMPSVFFFCVLLGFSAGLIAGGVLYDSPHVGYLWAGPGLVAGYVAGVFAARWVHALGFMAAWFIYLAILGLIFLPFEDLIVVAIYATKDQSW